jgi:hypothetical protein
MCSLQYRHVQACTGPGLTRGSYLLEAAMVDAPRVVEDSLAKTQTSLYIPKKNNPLSMCLFIFLPPAQPSTSNPKTMEVLKLHMAKDISVERACS